MFAPDQWPAYYSSANGVKVTDLDGNEYVDMSHMGVGSCILGYGDADVDEAASTALEHGVMSTLNPPEEVELAERLIAMHDWADMVRLGRPGGEAVAMAIRLARAYTGNETVAFCGYHGWHDWYLAANLDTETNLEEHLLPGLDPSGVPNSLEGTSKPFRYNDIEELERIACQNDLAAVIMEPIRSEQPEDDFFDRIQALTARTDVPLIIDEITAGFRVRAGGYHERIGAEPDIAVYGKAIGNGYPISAVVGKEHVMDEAQESFISSTFWTERIGPSAALTTIEKFSREGVGDHLVTIGNMITQGWEDLAEDHGLPIETKGIKPLTAFEIEHDDAQAAKTLFAQEMLDYGYLAGNSVYTSYAHTAPVVERYLEAVDQVFDLIAEALKTESVYDSLDGPVAHTKFERLN
ncbi:aminotransferase class III-fold pyridoxal phosphate-dependent enzyme [Natrarchaeobius sp. A-rgal3]|uniref:aminotransferase class III-fold pyridoxal phosphate-dependent enzyme n=1 Tax=Natrarchaeobius versutus TaxID=1679078 RepID=UPI003510B47F